MENSPISAINKERKLNKSYGIALWHSAKEDESDAFFEPVQCQHMKWKINWLVRQVIPLSQHVCSDNDKGDQVTYGRFYGLRGSSWLTEPSNGMDQTEFYSSNCSDLPNDIKSPTGNIEL